MNNLKINTDLLVKQKKLKSKLEHESIHAFYN